MVLVVVVVTVVLVVSSDDGFGDDNGNDAHPNIYIYIYIYIYKYNDAVYTRVHNTHNSEHIHTKYGERLSLVLGDQKKIQTSQVPSPC